MEHPAAVQPETINVDASVEAWLPLNLQAPSQARGVVAHCLSGRVDDDVLDSARVLVSELVTNSVRHSGATAPAEVAIRVTLNADAVRIEVEDPGHDGAITPRPPDRTRIGGHGLRLVQTLSDSWGLERFAAGPTRVWAQLAQPAAARNAGEPPPDPAPQWTRPTRRDRAQAPTPRQHPRTR